jgi:hypothetical protein
MSGNPRLGLGLNYDRRQILKNKTFKDITYDRSPRTKFALQDGAWAEFSTLEVALVLL